MKLISDIINELVDSEKSISSPLLKTKVLANRLGNQELLNWVKYELAGYPDEVQVPSYRICGCYVVGDYINGFNHVKRHQLPLDGLSNELKKLATTFSFKQSVASLESLIKEKQNGTVEMLFNPEIVRYIESTLLSENPYLQLLTASKKISVNAVVEILSVVRNELLDLMLKVDNEYGNLTEIELQSKKQEINQIMSQTIINNTGDGNVVNTGNNSKLTSTITISKGNKEELKEKLSNLGIEDSDTNELLRVIDVDIPSNENQNFNSNVNAWIQKMLGKSLDGTWQVAIATAGGILVEVIKSYYGFNF